VNPKSEVIPRLMERAAMSLEEAEMMLEVKHWNTCVNRLYYACFYAVSALLRDLDVQAGTHKGVRSMLALHLIKPGLLPLSAGVTFNGIFDCRLDSDYEELFEADPEAVEQFVPAAKTLVEEVRALLRRDGYEV
jgi:uncharacterized protein (UPF0332 family)